MLWLHSWLQQEEHRYPGPRCSDGILLREHRISKSNCEEITEIVPGCESNLSIMPTSDTVHGEFSFNFNTCSINYGAIK